MSCIYFIQDDDNWVSLKGKLDSKFIDLLKVVIKPSEYRKFDNDKKKWLVHWSKLDVLVDLAKRFYDQVDRSTLPEHWQMRAAGASMEEVTLSRSESPYDVLFLKENAPAELIKVAYKTLAQLYHPDHGGSDDLMAKLNLAYSKIISK